MIDVAKFQEAVTGPLFFGSLPSWQAKPLQLLTEAGVRRNRSINDIAYALATAYWESGRFKHKEEIGRGRGRDYGESVLVIRGQRETYYGRGYVQLTWLRNYSLMSLILTEVLGKEIDLVNNPDLAARPEISIEIIWEGMIRGTFTGKNLADYISRDHANFVSARRIINGTDKANKIASIAEKFRDALQASLLPMAA